MIFWSHRRGQLVGRLVPEHAAECLDCGGVRIGYGERRCGAPIDRYHDDSPPEVGYTTPEYFDFDGCLLIVYALFCRDYESGPHRARDRARRLGRWGQSKFGIFFETIRRETGLLIASRDTGLDLMRERLAPSRDWPRLDNVFSTGGGRQWIVLQDALRKSRRTKCAVCGNRYSERRESERIDAWVSNPLARYPVPRWGFEKLVGAACPECRDHAARIRRRKFHGLATARSRLIAVRSLVNATDMERATMEAKKQLAQWRRADGYQTHQARRLADAEGRPSA